VGLGTRPVLLGLAIPHWFLKNLLKLYLKQPAKQKDINGLNVLSTWFGEVYYW
jgi:hypothetical protein